MIKVLLVDDEPRILQFLQTSIPWSQLNLNLVGTAFDGETALQLISVRHIDIVITDIRMPGMTGLNLCQCLKKDNPDIQIILISGYADFFYAKQALHLGIVGYCLKPINLEELTTYLLTAIRRIQKERSTNVDVLLDCIETKDNEEICSILEEMGLGAGPYRVAASSGMHNIGSELQAKVSCRLGKHKYIYFSDTPFDRDNAVKLICFSDKNAGIGIYPKAVQAIELSEAVQTAITFSHQYFLAGRSFLCEHPVSETLTAEIYAQLHTALHSPQSLHEFLNKLLAADLSLLFNISSAFQFYNTIYIEKFMPLSEKKHEYYLYGFDQFEHEYTSFNHALRELIHALEAENSSQNEYPQISTSTFLKIMKYINANYEKDLSLKLLSDTFHLNASYISTLIKNETNMTYSQYVTNLRIEKAKSLLQTTNMSLAEISELVGFNDYFYFIKKFKKETGVTPGHYRH